MIPAICWPARPGKNNLTKFTSDEGVEYQILNLSLNLASALRARRPMLQYFPQNDLQVDPHGLSLATYAAALIDFRSTIFVCG